MAEFVFKDMITKQGFSDQFIIASAATSTEEIGNPVHYGTRNKLNSLNIPVGNHRARQITKNDLEELMLYLLIL